MAGPIEALGDFIVAHRAWAAPAFGLLALGESTAILGIVIPATPILFLMGTLLGSGKLDVVPVLAWAVPGAVGGYWLSWAVGLRLGTRIYHGRALKRHRRGVARARLFFMRWGGPALVIGRFALGPFQSMLPLVAGVAKMDARRFNLWNLASGISWVIVCLAPGYLTAKGLWAVGADPRIEQAMTVVLAAISVGVMLAALAGVAWRLWRGRPAV